MAAKYNDSRLSLDFLLIVAPHCPHCEVCIPSLLQLAWTQLKKEPN